jgi:hypothetical protein
MGTILVAYLFILPAQTSATHVYQNGQCSYSFEYADGWQIVRNPDDLSNDCPATLRRADYERRMSENDVDVYTLNVQVSEGTFLQVAAEQGFDFDGKWMIMGRQGSSDEAQVNNDNGWLILRGIAAVGCFHEKGGYAGLCEEHRVVAKHMSDHRVVAISGGAQTEDAINAILKTFKFVNR